MIFSGVDIEVISGHIGWKESNWFAKNLKNEHLIYFYVGESCLDVSTTKEIIPIHDRKGIIKTHLKNPVKFLTRHGITWVYGKNDTTVLKKINSKQFESAGLNMSSNKKDICGENKTTTTTIEYTQRFNK